MTNKQAYAGLLERLLEPKTRNQERRDLFERQAAEAISTLLKTEEQAVSSLWAIKELANGLGETLIEAEAERLLAALNSDAPLSIGEGL